MKKLFLYMSISCMLQVGFYFLFMHNHFAVDRVFYNPISILSVFFFLGLYIKKTRYILKHTDRIWVNIKIALMLSGILFSLLVILSLLGNISLAVVYFFFTNLTQSTYTSGLPTLIWHYNLGVFNLIMFMLNIFLVLKAYPSNKEELDAKVIYIGLSVLLLSLYILGMVLNLPLIYYHGYMFTSFFIFWFFIPVFYNLINQFHHYYGVLFAWVITALFYWQIIYQLFSDLLNIHGFILGN
ncbi:hypothetical protein [Liberiplasma polymorphum]|jgi:hypothetical protein|uniref:hypothetical protein n=1 Tax=Liberiplasma polymorphum TaxID=3374570 RepID=UPI0037718A7F